MAYKLVKTEGGKTNWQLIRRVFYTALIVWVFGVRAWNIDPFGLVQMIPIAWLFDALSLAALAALVWHLYEYRPQKSPG